MVHTRGQRTTNEVWKSDDDFLPQKRVKPFQEKLKKLYCPNSDILDGETESDMACNNEAFPQSSRRTQQINSNGEDLEFSVSKESKDLSNHNTLALRRSTRQRKCSSWLLGSTQLRGYPNMVNGFEQENGDDSRTIQSEQRRVVKSNQSTLSPYRRSRKFSGSSDRRVLRAKRNYRFQSKYPRENRRPTRCYSDIESEEENLTEDATEDEDEAKEKSRHNEDFDKEQAAQTNGIVNGNTSSSEDSQDSGKKRSRRAPLARRRLCNLRDVSSETCEEKEVDNTFTMEQNSSEKSEKEDEKPKRVRKPVMRFSYNDFPLRSQNKPSSSFTSDSSSGDEEESKSWSQKRRSERTRPRSGGYLLRQNRRPLVQNNYESFDEMSPRHRNKSRKSLLHSARKQKALGRKYRPTHNADSSSTSSSSSSDEKEFEKRKSKSMKKARNQFLPMNFLPEDLTDATFRDRMKVGSSLADVDPMHVDSSVNFDSIGGLSTHIKSLKEMIIFPLMYPEVFQKFSITPPRGVLFYGSPGTGKTLVARALANECSKKDKKVAFFMRKGADCLSKWVGESERQLRILFDQAYQMRPSIIFFDEIDGLAPVRSARQDQIHSSIVSTLLALMDGLDDRGEIIVIGATNRVDAIDPALRRPGRFDREFHFPLPGVQARRKILEIHTKSWSPSLSKQALKFLGDQTTGYCGADLKALCTEASLNALKSRYPQIYQSERKLKLDLSQIKIKIAHFREAISKIIPAGQRACNSPHRRLDKAIQPLLQSQLSSVTALIRESFPVGFSNNSGTSSSAKPVHLPRIVISGTKGQGQTTHLAPAVLHALENVPTFKLDFPSLFSLSTKSPHEACAQTFHEALRNLPSILYIPLIDQWWDTVEDTVKTTFLCVLTELDPSSPLLIVATSETPYGEMHDELREMFSFFRNEVFVMSNPDEESRRAFFKPLFFIDIPKVFKPKPVQVKKPIEQLEFAPAPQPRQLTDREVKKIERIEEATLRELRIFLREICSKLAKNRMFYIFTKPVDLEEVPDYLEVIEKPMDLETMMVKIDEHKYECAEDFLDDIDLVCSNALEYNPATNPEDKLIRHRAYALRDTAYAIIKAEMDTDFEDKCQEVRKKRSYRKKSSQSMDTQENKVCDLDKIETKKATTSCTALSSNNSPLTSTGKKRQRRRKSNWARGMLKKSLPARRTSGTGVGDTKDVKTDSSCVVVSSSPDKRDPVPCSPTAECVFNSPASGGLLDTGFNSEEVKSDGIVHTTSDSGTIRNGLDEPQVDLKNEPSYASVFSTPPSKRLRANSNSLDTVKLVPEVSLDIKLPVCQKKEIDSAKIEELFNLCLENTQNSTTDQLCHLRNVLSRLVSKHFRSHDKVDLLQEVETELRKFVQSK